MSRNRMDKSWAGAPRRLRLTSCVTSAGRAKNRPTWSKRSRISSNNSRNPSLTSASSRMDSNSCSNLNRKLNKHSKQWIRSKMMTIAPIMNMSRSPVDSLAGNSKKQIRATARWRISETWLINRSWKAWLCFRIWQQTKRQPLTNLLTCHLIGRRPSKCLRAMWAS